VTKRRSRGEGSIYFLKSKGLWVSKITLPDGSRKVKYGKSQKEVRDYHQETLNQLRQGMMVKDDNITVSEFLNRYMESVAKHTLRPRTIEAHSSLIRIHINPGIGHIKLVQLRPDHLQNFYSQKLEEGLSKRTVRYIHSVLHKTLKQALMWGMVSRNVSDLVEAPRPEKYIPQFYTKEQINKLLKAVEDHRYYPIYVLAVYCGFREGEVLGIHHEDIDLQNGVINVRHAVLTLKGGLVITEPKTASSKRAVTLPPTALKVLKKHLEQLKNNQGLIFTTSTGRPISPRNLVRHFKSAIKKAGLPDIRFHDLRHSHASLLLAAGVNPKIVQERLGHSQISLTLDTYSHVIPSLQDEAAEKVEEILSK